MPTPTVHHNGIRVLGSSIIGLEHHSPENIGQIIDYAISHETDFHQFMLYTPVAGTPLFEQHRKEGTLLPNSEISAADAHGQYRFNYRHRYIHDGHEEKYLLNAFEQDFEKNAAAIAFENEPGRHPKTPMLRKRWVAGEFYPQPASYPIRRQSWK
jgi:hypothetical protein